MYTIGVLAVPTHGFICYFTGNKGSDTTAVSKVVKVSKEIYCSEFPGFTAISVPFDGNCLFAALADQLFFNGIDSEKRLHSDIRRQLVDYIRHDSALLSQIAVSLEKGDTAVKYLDRMSKNGCWGDGIMLAAANLLFKKRIAVYKRAELKPMVIDNDSAEQIRSDCLTLGFISDTPSPSSTENHYISLRKEKENMCKQVNSNLR